MKRLPWRWILLGLDGASTASEREAEPIVLDQAPAGTVRQPYSFFVGRCQQRFFNGRGQLLYLFAPQEYQLLWCGRAVPVRIEIVQQ